MKKIIIISIVFIAGVFGFFLLRQISTSHANQRFLLNPVAPKRASQNPQSSPTPILLAKPIHILLLGVDARHGDKNPRCDAVHFFSFDPTLGKIRIISVPRGTTVKIPDVATESAYLGNSCHIKGVDFAVSEITKITGTKPDYLVKAGFSQTLGILRTLNFPTTPTLQFLRNRRFGLGDYQRSHNQALFLKETIVDNLPKFMKLPKPIQYLAYKMIDTNMPFETASLLLRQIADSNILTDPNNIELVTKPPPAYKPKDLYFGQTEFAISSSWQNDEEYQTYQNDLLGYLENLVDRGNQLLENKQTAAAYKIIKTPFEQQLWLQVEDEEKRNVLHFELLKIYVLSSPDKSNLSSFILDFITEMEAYKKDEWKKEGEELLKNISR